MPKPFSLLQKCSEIRTDGAACRAVAVKNTLYCRHHLSNHPEELAKITKDGSYAFLKDDEEEACRVDLNSTDEVTVLKATVRILSGQITKLLKEPIDGKTLISLLKIIGELRKAVETLTKRDEYWKQKGEQIINEELKRLKEILKKYIDEEKWQQFLQDLKDEGLKREQERQGDGIQQ